MGFLNKMERKYNRYAIRDLTKYVIILYAIGVFLGFVNPAIYYNYLALDFSQIAHGQVWRLVTFLMQPYLGATSPLTGVLFFGIEAYLYLMIGRGLEQTWGALRYNLYIISGILFNLLAGLIIYLISGVPYPIGITYILKSMFLAFAILYPDLQLMLWFVIPLKIKWLGYLYGIILGYEAYSYFASGKVIGYVMGVAVIVSVANFLLFWFWSRKRHAVSRSHAKRRRAMRRAETRRAGDARHRCAICGRTEQDNPDLQFRFCSKCEGNYEYCNDHLFTHNHVKR